ncbi:hypothetical protein DBR32_11245 [Taibaiella sp. KBW10]|uniref:hypothetical protein n=1 Tax=Taibaiella sp. KBW10 TaxID=2153357 RepID=UPI000F5B4BAF|nr:hypothetical protein [Taibaiella sp. KBW10]RQO30153.1 hypothetical protein DBR32_11245 [Taibaiella sp. KBW10]
MKKLIYVSAILMSMSALISCGGNEAKNEAKGETASKEKPSSAGVNEADWELKEVSGIVKELEIPAFSVKLPKDAKIEKDTSSLTPGLLVTFPNKYELRIQFKEHALMSQNMAKVIANSKETDIDTDTTERKSKILLENANGYIYTTTVIDGSTGENLGDPVCHFSYYIKDKGDSYIVIDDSRYSGIVNNEGEVFSEANTKKIWEIIAGSATFK